MLVSVGEVQFPYFGEEVSLRLYWTANVTFTTSTGVLIPKGSLFVAASAAGFTPVSVTDNLATAEAFEIHSTADGTPNYSNYSFWLADTDGNPVGRNDVLYSSVQIPAETPITFELIAAYNDAVCTDLAEARYFNRDQVLALIGDIDGAPIALTNRLGKMYISHTAADVDGPIAVEDNDHIIRALRQRRYLSEFDGNDLETAITEIMEGLGEGEKAVLEISDFEQYTRDAEFITAGPLTVGKMYELVTNPGTVAGVRLRNEMSAGTGYTTDTDVATTGGSGTGLTVDITAVDGVVTSVVVADAGEGDYLIDDVITIGAGDENAQIVVTHIDGDDFSNTGKLGKFWFATDTTPTDWTHGSTLREYLTVPSEIFVLPSGPGSLRAENGGGIHIKNLLAPPARQVFRSDGEGKIVVEGPTELDYAWWADPESSSNDRNAFVQAINSCELDGVLGGTIRYGVTRREIGGIEVPSNVSILASGNGYDLAHFGGRLEGSVMLLPDGYDYIFKIHDRPGDEYPRNIEIARFGLDIGDNVHANAIYNGGRQGEDGTTYITNIHNNTLHGTAEAAGQTLMWLNGDENTESVGWETIGNLIKQNIFLAPPNGCDIKIQTENCSINLEMNTTHVGKGDSVCIDILRGGWIKIDNNDGRGWAFEGYSANKTEERTLPDVTLSEPTIWDNDEVHSTMTINDSEVLDRNDLKKAISIAVDDFEAYIAKVIDDKTALLSWHPDGFDYSSFENVAATVSTWDEDPNISGTAIRLRGNVGGLHILGGVEEGFNRSLDLGTGQYSGTVTVRDYTMQGLIVLNNSINLSLERNRIPACSIIDDAGAGPDAMVLRDKNVVRLATTTPGVVVAEGEAYGYRKPAPNMLATRELYCSDITEYIDNYDLDPEIAATGHRQEIWQHSPFAIRDIGYSWPLSKPRLSIGHSTLNQTNDEQEDPILFECGYQNPLGPEFGLLYKMWITHHTFDGSWRIFGDFVGFEKLFVMMPFYMKDGGELSGDALTAHTNINSLAQVKGISKASNAVGIGYDETLACAADQIQATDRSTAVTSNGLMGLITTRYDSLADGTDVTFTVNNSCVQNLDSVHIDVQMANGGYHQSNVYKKTQTDGSFTIAIQNKSGSPDTNAYYIRYSVIKRFT